MLVMTFDTEQPACNLQTLHTSSTSEPREKVTPSVASLWLQMGNQGLLTTERYDPNVANSR